MAWGDPCSCGDDCQCVNCPEHGRHIKEVGCQRGGRVVPRLARAVLFFLVCWTQAVEIPMLAVPIFRTRSFDAPPTLGLIPKVRQTLLLGRKWKRICCMGKHCERV